MIQVGVVALQQFRAYDLAMRLPLFCSSGSA
jgi:hypothetical protein